MRILKQVLSVLGISLICAAADVALMKEHCSKCHTGEEPKGEFDLQDLGKSPNAKNLDYWLGSLEYVRAEEMPPAKDNRLTVEERERLVAFLQKHVSQYEESAGDSAHPSPRRLNNREFANSLCDVLMIEDVGTHHPTAMLLADTLRDGFDTHAEALGMSEFHLDQYVRAIRKVLDATILSGEQPPTKKWEISSQQLRVASSWNRTRPERANRTTQSVDLLNAEVRAYMDGFETVRQTGRYRITLRAQAVDRHVYDEEKTGIYDADPLKLRVHMGDRLKDFELPEDEVLEISLEEWLAAGTRLQFSFPTDGLRLMGNGNFKFQNRIAHDYIKANRPKLYHRVITEEVPKANYNRRKRPAHHSHWSPYWQGPRPRLYSATVEGPIYDSWPPKRQKALLGENPSVAKAESILRSIARRAWRRDVGEEELSPIVRLVRSQAETLGDLAALKEGIVAILTSPSFLMIHPDEGTLTDRFATKLSYFLGSTTPDAALIDHVHSGKLDSVSDLVDEIRKRVTNGQADAFLRHFPHGWLQLDRINFMAPDPDRYPLYEKKRVSEDMVNEVLAFFRHAVEKNRPVPELLTANYSFINADLAKIYEVDGVPGDSLHRKHTFHDGRRGGFLGMGAFLTLTADNLTTSPIHRAIYVMENFMGIHPSPPPADVEIEEPDIRSARTIREVLAAHSSDRTCASCHQTIDPFGYAFENFDPVGAWRDFYDFSDASPTKRGRRVRKPEGIPIDASATFLSGTQYEDIIGFRQQMKSKANRERFVRCFITKLLTYANGEEPKSFSAIEEIVSMSRRHDYRIIETMAEVVNSPLFRGIPRSSGTAADP